jgi:glutathione S-transferase
LVIPPPDRSPEATPHNAVASLAGETAMIEVWTWPTPDGHKVRIPLEELGLPYKVISINIGKGDLFKPEFLAITPNHRIPAIVDPDGPGARGRRSTAWWETREALSPARSKRVMKQRHI